MLAVLLVTPFFVTQTKLQAQGTQIEYQVLAPLPGTTNTGADGAERAKASEYIQGLFRLLIGVAGALAVVMIIVGGIQYMSTDAFSGKSSAKDTIQNALWGLALAAGAWIILASIDKSLVEFNLNIEPVDRIERTGPATRSATGPIGSGPAHLALSSQQVQEQFKNADIKVEGSPRLEGLRQIVIDELVDLKNRCNCDILVTSATGGSHATTGTCNHGNGYKIDVRKHSQGQTMTDFITRNYERLPDRNNKGRMEPLYKSPTGALYALESTHWDIARCN